MNVLVLAVLIVLIEPLRVHAASDDYPTVQFRGFGTAALGGTDTDRLGFRRVNNQRRGLTRSWGFDNDSRLGLQLDVDFSRTWHAGVQWVARNHVGDFFEQNLDWAYLRWRPLDDLDIRLGRLGLDLFFLSEYREVGYAYPWIRPPHEFYAANPVYHFDGADVSKRFRIGDGHLTAKLFGGYAYYQLPIYKTDVLNGGVTLLGGNLVFERGNWRARIGHVFATQETELPLQELRSAMHSPDLNAVWPAARALSAELRTRGNYAQFSSVGLAYDDGTWLAQAEAHYTDSNMSVQPNVLGGYLSLGRRIDAVTLYSVYGTSHSLHHQINVPMPAIQTPDLMEIWKGVDTAFNGNGLDQQSATVGVRWDAYRNVAIKAEWNHYWLGQHGTVLWDDPGTGDVPHNVNVWSFGVDFLF
jgi:hypothetical protein